MSVLSKNILEPKALPLSTLRRPSYRDLREPEWSKAFSVTSCSDPLQNPIKWLWARNGIIFLSYGQLFIQNLPVHFENVSFRPTQSISLPDWYSDVDFFLMHFIPANFWLSKWNFFYRPVVSLSDLWLVNTTSSPGCFSLHLKGQKSWARGRAHWFYDLVSSKSCVSVFENRNDILKTFRG